MNIYLGNIKFDQIENHLGFKLNKDDKIIWDKYHSNAADLSEKESCFHVFDMPKCIKFKGEEAKNAIIQMFTEDKLVNPMGKFHVFESK